MAEAEMPEAAEVPAEAPPPAPAEEFPFNTLPPQIRYQLKEVQPAAWLHVTPNDQLAVQIINGQTGITVYVALRLLLPSGEIKEVVEEYSPPATRMVQSYWIRLTESYLLSAAVMGTALVKVGACWVRCMLVYGAPKWHSFPVLLAAGYVAELSGLAWPYPRYIHPCEGPGRLRLINGTDPAPGNNVVEQVPTGARWRLVGVRVGLTTSAVAGDRRVALALYSGAWQIFYGAPLVVQTASQTWTYSWGIGVDARADSTVRFAQDSLPEGMYLSGGDQLYIARFGGDAGDDFSFPTLYVEEWIEP